MLAGLAFAALLIAEICLAVIVVAFHAGKLVLGLAILIEALSRVGGTVAAERAGQRGWAFACAIVGAPIVAWVALVPRSGRITTEPAPLAGLLAVLAGVVALVGLLPEPEPRPLRWRWWIPSLVSRSFSTAILRGARCSRSTSGGSWRRSLRA